MPRDSRLPDPTRQSIAIKQTVKCAINNATIAITQKLSFLSYGYEWDDFGGNVQQPMLGLAPVFAKSIGNKNNSLGFSTGGYSPFNTGTVVYSTFRILTFGGPTNTDVFAGSDVRNYKNYGIETLIPATCPYGGVEYTNTLTNPADYYFENGYFTDGEFQSQGQVGGPGPLNLERYVPGVLDVNNKIIPAINSKFKLSYNAITEAGLPTQGQFVIRIAPLFVPTSPMPAASMPESYNQFDPTWAKFDITIQWNDSFETIETKFKTAIGVNNVIVSGTDLRQQIGLYKDAEGNKYKYPILNDPTDQSAFEAEQLRLGLKKIGTLFDGQITFEITGTYAGTPMTSCTISSYTTDKYPTLKELTIGSQSVDSLGGRYTGRFVLSKTDSSILPCKVIPKWFVTIFDHLDVRVVSGYINWLKQLNAWHGWGYDLDAYFNRYDGHNQPIPTNFEPLGTAQTYDTTTTNYISNGYPISNPNLLIQIKNLIITICKDQFKMPVNGNPIWATAGGFIFSNNYGGIPDHTDHNPCRGDWYFSPKITSDYLKYGKNSVDDFTSLLPNYTTGLTSISRTNTQNYPFYIIKKRINQSVVKPMYDSFTYSFTLDMSGIDLSLYTHFQFVSPQFGNTEYLLTIATIPIAQFGIDAILDYYRNFPILGTLGGTYDDTTNKYTFTFLPRDFASGIAGINGPAFVFGILDGSGNFIDTKTANSFAVVTDIAGPRTIGYYMPKNYIRYKNQPPKQLWFERQILWKVDWEDQRISNGVITNFSGTYYVLGGTRSSPRWSNAISAGDLNTMMGEVLQDPANFTLNYRNYDLNFNHTLPGTETWTLIPTMLTTDTPTYSEEFFGALDPTISTGHPEPNTMFYATCIEPSCKYTGSVSSATNAWGVNIDNTPKLYYVELRNVSNLQSRIQGPLELGGIQIVPYNGNHGTYPQQLYSFFGGRYPNMQTSGPGVFEPTRQGLSNITYSEIQASYKVESYSATTANQITNAKLTSGWGITTDGNASAQNSMSRAGSIIGVISKDSLACCLDTKGRTIRQFLGLKFLTTTITNIVGDTTQYMFNYYKNVGNANDFGVDEKNANWTCTMNPYGRNHLNGQNSFTTYSTGNSWYLSGGSQYNPSGGSTYSRNFTAKLTIKYGSIPGNLRYPNNNFKVNTGAHAATTYLNSFNPFDTFTSSIVVEKQYLEVRHKQMMDAMLTTGTLLGTVTFDQTFFPDGHEINDIVPPTINSSRDDSNYGVKLPDMILQNLPNLADMIVPVGNIIFILLDLDITPTGIQSVNNLKDSYNITKIGPTPVINFFDGCSVSNFGVSSNDTNSAIKKFTLGTLQVDVQNRIHQ